MSKLNAENVKMDGFLFNFLLKNVTFGGMTLSEAVVLLRWKSFKWIQVPLYSFLPINKRSHGKFGKVPLPKKTNRRPENRTLAR